MVYLVQSLIEVSIKFVFECGDRRRGDNLFQARVTEG